MPSPSPGAQSVRNVLLFCHVALQVHLPNPLSTSCVTTIQPPPTSFAWRSILHYITAAVGLGRFRDLSSGAVQIACRDSRACLPHLLPTRRNSPPVSIDQIARHAGEGTVELHL